ncbi:helix-turn-helix transcriptional regulator [Streptomyces sp. Tu 2975]|uniref:helix-turn-helix domain-containing protein n=1 Tax=Streptomyces sp. Tu 2975 TaxID=2676871 RepID=UPI001359AAF0|nr:helix-turn-helix transcriptional regulator [Streptomyces sp. Tu 2975]QIP87606.1 helix-turn-helix transcriptional regulator [Streptomyces sp. Tu 2975]
MNAEDQLRSQVRAALERTNISQAEAARQLGLSTKHMSQMLTGRATLTLDWAERIVALCGMRIVVLALTGTPDEAAA